ncbi:MAG: lipid asymmetry maintenance protein MlaB [Sulfurifustis sp.]
MTDGARPAPAAESAAVTRSDGMLSASGSLTFETVPGLLDQTQKWLQEPGGAITVDLKGVTRADSAGLALLVEWLRLARLKNRPLTFSNVPDQVCSLIRVNSLGHALGVNGS